MSIPYPVQPWEDQQTFSYKANDGSTVTGIYNSSKNAWTFSRSMGDQGGGITPGGVVTTVDVRTVNQRPDEEPNTQPFSESPVGTNVQRDVNWWLFDEINSILYVDNQPPVADNNTHGNKFWYDTNRLELFIWYEDAWLPASPDYSGGISEETFTYTVNRIYSLTDEIYLKNIQQDNRLDVLEENIVELEEEIDAIAPSVERGEWNFNPLVASPSHYTLLKGDGSNTDIFSQARLIFVSTTDADSNPHGFNNHEPGELLQIFNKDDNEYGLYEITDIDDNSSNSQNPYFSFTVDFVRAFSTTGKAINRGRFKFFNAPQGGTADGFVLKTGDTMEGPGPLTIKTKKTSDDFNSPGSNTAYIKFENDNNGSINSLSLYRGGPDKTLIADGGFTARGHIWSSGHYYAYNGSSTRFPSLRLEENEGKLAWGSSTGYAKLKWNTRGISEMMFNNSIGETGQVPTKTDAGIEWVTPGQVLTNWDLINANDKNWGNEFYHNALITGFGGYKSNGDEYNGQSNYGIFISDSMLEKLLKEDYPDKEIDIDKWVKYWTGEGTIELNTGNSGANGTSQTRTLTEVKRVNYNNDGRYPGVKLMWADQASLSFYSLFIKFVKTAGAFEAGEVNTIQVPASNILYYTGSYTPSREEDVNDSTVYWLDRNGNISNSTPSNGAFFPWAWIKENYPWMTGLNIMDGLGVSGIYDAFGNAKSLLDPTKTFNSFPAYVNPREFNGVRGIGIWSDNQMGSNDRIQLWGLQESFEYYTINN